MYIGSPYHSYVRRRYVQTKFYWHQQRNAKNRAHNLLQYNLLSINDSHTLSITLFQLHHGAKPLLVQQLYLLFHPTSTNKAASFNNTAPTRQHTSITKKAPTRQLNIIIRVTHSKLQRWLPGTNPLSR